MREGDLVRHGRLRLLMTVLAVSDAGITCIRPPTRPGERTRTQRFDPRLLEPVPDAAIWS